MNLSMLVSSQDALEQFMLYIQVEKNFSVHTVREYESDLLDFLTFLQGEGINDLASVEYIHARLYVTKLYDEKEQGLLFLEKYPPYAPSSAF